MTEQDYAQTLLIFKAALKGIRNDDSLGMFLIELGAELVALGVKELKAPLAQPASKIRYRQSD